MYNFSNMLQDDEIILAQGNSIPGKGNKNIGVSIFLMFFSIACEFLLIASAIGEANGNIIRIDLKFILMFLIILSMFAFGVYNLIYSLFIKKRKVADDIYCLTNKRVFKYETKTQKLVFGYLASYEEIKCQNEKDEYGDLYFGIIYKQGSDGVKTLVDVMNLAKNPDPKNMPCIILESIYKPQDVKTLAVNARNQLLNK